MISQEENAQAFVAGWTAVAAQRLKQEIKRFGSQAAVAKGAGISRPSLVAILAFDEDAQDNKKGSRPRYATLQAICDVLGVDPADIIAGRPSLPAAQQMALVRVPYYQDVAVSAGGGAVPFEPDEPGGYWSFPPEVISDMAISAKYLRLLPVKGESMAPTLNDGDWIMIDESRVDGGDGIYALFYDDALLVKRVQYEGRTVRLLSDNSHYRPIEVKKGDGDGNAFRLIGRVIWKAGAL